MNCVRLAAVATGRRVLLPLATTSLAIAETAAKVDAAEESARDQCAAQIPDCVRLCDPLSGNRRAIEGSEWNLR